MYVTTVIAAAVVIALMFARSCEVQKMQNARDLRMQYIKDCAHTPASAEKNIAGTEEAN
jgi:hypothetical protein